MNGKPVIGFIGLGLMGHGIAKNIRKGGYDLWVLGRTQRGPVESLLSLGATEAASAREMAERCDIIHICVSNSQQVESIIRSENGILAGACRGLIVIDTSTAAPASTLQLARDLAVKDAFMVDAPLGRTPKEAEEGTLDAMVGCDPAIFDTIRPVINCWASTVNWIGPVGSGHKMKLLMNFIGLSYAALFSEAAVLAAKTGISPRIFRDVIAGSRMGNAFFSTFMRYVVDRDRDAHKFTIANAAKDMRYVSGMAAEAGMMTIMAAAASQYFAHVEAIGRSTDYIPMLSDYVGTLNGVDMAEEMIKRPSI